MSTIYYGKGPLFFKTESALMAYLNQKSTDDFQFLNPPETQSHSNSNNYSIIQILLIGGCIILIIYLLGKASENAKLLGEDISNVKI